MYLLHVIRGIYILIKTVEYTKAVKDIIVSLEKVDKNIKLVTPFFSYNIKEAEDYIELFKKGLYSFSKTDYEQIFKNINEILEDLRLCYEFIFGIVWNIICNKIKTCRNL
jgi:hypothetical protein